jgi:hypothetical protein
MEAPFHAPERRGGGPAQHRERLAVAGQHRAGEVVLGRVADVELEPWSDARHGDQARLLERAGVGRGRGAERQEHGRNGGLA